MIFKILVLKCLEENLKSDLLALGGEGVVRLLHPPPPGVAAVGQLEILRPVM